MALRKLVFFFLLGSIICTTSYAQQNNRLEGYGIEVNPTYGKIIKHNYIFPPLPKQSYAIDINILKQTTGKKDWQLRRNYPLIGLGITYTNYGIDSIYGKCIGVYPVWEMPIIRKEKLEWTCRIGFGVGYVTKRFERYPSWDTINNLIGSHFNNFTVFSTDLRYKMNEHIHLQAGFNFSHISNGSFRLPNLGINMYGGHVGVRYFPVTDNPKRIQRSLPTMSNRWMAQVRLGIGMIEYNNVDGPMYPVYIVSALASKRYGSRNKVFGGIDYSHFTAIYAFQRANEVNPGDEKANSWEGSIFIGNEFLIGRFGVIAQLGFPFHHTAINKDISVQKLGYSYYILQKEQGILKELAVQGFIKANNLEASTLEFGLGAGL